MTPRPLSSAPTPPVAPAPLDSHTFQTTSPTAAHPTLRSGLHHRVRANETGAN